jgi:RNA polymerase sigma-70 factor, ECF subfamily
MNGGEAQAEARKLQRLEEVLWVIQAQAGDTDAFERLMARYEKPLLYYLRRLAPDGDTALDLHQEVWVDAFRGLKSVQVPEAFRAWLYRIAHNKAARAVRNEIAREGMLQTLAGEPGAAESPHVHDTWGAQAVHQALMHLTPPEREILVLHYLQDLSLQELGSVLGCPVGTAKSRLHYARVELRRIIERKKL